MDRKIKMEWFSSWNFHCNEMLRNKSSTHGYGIKRS